MPSLKVRLNWNDFFQANVSSNEGIQFCYYETCFCSFFGGNWRYQKYVSKLTDLSQNTKIRSLDHKFKCVIKNRTQLVLEFKICVIGQLYWSANCKKINTFKISLKPTKILKYSFFFILLFECQGQKGPNFGFYSLKYN